jgi:malate permease and related proteins
MMPVAWTAFGAVAAVFMMMAVGWILGRRGTWSEETDRKLSSLALDVAFPCLLLSVLLRQFDPVAHTDWWRWPAAWLVFTAVTLGPALLLARAVRPAYRREFALSLFYPNALFLPIPLIRQMYGPASPVLVDLILFTMLFSAVFFSTSGWFYRPIRDPAGPPIRLHPALWATALAILLRVTRADAFIPEFAVSGLEQIGQISIPLIMMTIGSRLGREFLATRQVYWREILIFVAVKNVLWPLLALAVLAAWRPSARLGFMIFLQCAMPPVSATPAISARMNGNPRLAGQLLLASFGVSVATLPPALYMFRTLFAL